MRNIVLYRFYNIGIIIALAIICSSLSCNTNSNIPDFTQITETNINGEPSQGGSIDVTDWKLNDVFSNDENALFGNVNTLSNCSVVSTEQVIGFPNASNGIFILNSNLSNVLSAEIRIVDKNFNLLKFISSSSALQLVNFDLSNLVASGDYIRVYYKFISASCEYRGHGDIKIVK
jgi:hypothetical protein